MKQVFRRVLDKKGTIVVDDVPIPAFGSDQVLIRTQYTVISAGTEGATLSKTFPELVKQTLKDPWMRNAVKNLLLGSGPETMKNIVLDETTLMRSIGYSGMGYVEGVGKNVSGYKIGDRVAFAAEGHAEYVAPTRNFIVHVPDSLASMDAAFVTLGGIALQGVRRAELQIGEHVVVYGLGLVGLLVSQICYSAGAHVIGVDINPENLKLLKQLIPNAKTVAASDGSPVDLAIAHTGGYGADAVIICASSSSAEIANNAMKMCRKQARVVFVGIVKMNLERMPFFKNELDLKFSRAYGPGVMDAEYDRGRVDYPYHYVRWTEQRNLESFLKLVADGRVNVSTLIKGVYDIHDAQDAYNALLDSKKTGVASILKFSCTDEGKIKSLTYRTKKQINGSIKIGIIGCGNFSRSIHIPNIANNKHFSLQAVASKTGVNAISVCKRFNIEKNTTDYMEIINDPGIDAVLIATRHNMHAELTCLSLLTGKHVFVEKPACLTTGEYQNISDALQKSSCVFMVGYNRRYAKLSKEMKDRLSPDLPMFIQYHICIPEIPKDHWTLDEQEGGGRLIGEAEHFFDYAVFLAGSKPSKIEAGYLKRDDESAKNQYNFYVNLQFNNHAIASIIYTSFSSPLLPREMVTVHQGSKTYILDNFKKLTIIDRKRKTERLIFADFGHENELNTFANRIKGLEAADQKTLLAASEISITAQNIIAQS